jgi:hypothetical protein
LYLSVSVIFFIFYLCYLYFDSPFPFRQLFSICHFIYSFHSPYFILQYTLLYFLQFSYLLIGPEGRLYLTSAQSCLLASNDFSLHSVTTLFMNLTELAGQRKAQAMSHSTLRPVSARSVLAFGVKAAKFQHSPSTSIALKCEPYYTVRAFNFFTCCQPWCAIRS